MRNEDLFKKHKNKHNNAFRDKEDEKKLKIKNKRDEKDLWSDKKLCRQRDCGTPLHWLIPTHTCSFCRTVTLLPMESLIGIPVQFEPEDELEASHKATGGPDHIQYLERLSRAWMKWSVPELSFSGLSIRDMVAKTTSLARNLCLNPKWMLKVCTRISFILSWEEAMWLSPSSGGQALTARPTDDLMSRKGPY